MNDTEFVKRKNIRVKDHDYSSLQAYLITICSFNRKNLFCHEDLNQEIINCLMAEKKRTNFRLYVYCLMPDHLHLLLSPPGDGLSVSQFIGGFKSKTTRIGWKYGIEGSLWQGRFCDRILRKKEKMSIVGEYILNNPVRKEFVDDWRKYQYCGIIDYWI
jgi:putative transposase